MHHYKLHTDDSGRLHNWATPEAWVSTLCLIQSLTETFG